MSTTLTVQTWNCFGVAMGPLGVIRGRGAPDAHRLIHPDVRDQLERADVVCMQELWIDEAVELFESLSFEHKVRDSNQRRWVPLTIGGSGLGIATRRPIIERQNKTFRERGWGTDRGARKGVLHARLRLAEGPDRELDVFTTHVQAGFSGQSRRRRARQLTEIRQIVDELSAPDRPLLVCGDMNIDGLAGARGDEYAHLVETFSDLEDLGAAADEPTMCPDLELNALAHRYWSAEPLQRLDYLLYRPSRPAWLAVDQVERTLDQQLPPHGGPATYPSDHFGLQVRFRVDRSD
ncbi:MAG: endonuclease/exonuclease/phosphatase family protein [Deltaproteobacteria bacterium]|nr:endonuclease/exonuclease/phosphatase family protein [Deltaproteobacteria bacterium]